MRSSLLCLSLVGVAACRPAPPAAAEAAFSIDDDNPQIGYDTEFTVHARRSAGTSIGGNIRWTQSLGRPIALIAAEDGWSVRFRTIARATTPEAQTDVLPRSYDEAGQLELTATLTTPDGTRAVQHWHGGAMARSNGLPGLAVGHVVELGGGGWRAAQPSNTIRADLDGAPASVVAEKPGHLLLRDAHGADFGLRAGRYDETPLDCGRTDCHPSLASEALGTKMTAVLARGLDGAFGDAYDPRCAIACHSAGEPGTKDGGFADVMRAMGYSLPSRGSPGTWAALPRALRRLGGVGCTACHGPGAIPDPHGRWAVLRAGVCAVCHDATPRYGHVAAWRRSAMSRSDASLETRTRPECARCHTTFSFLSSLGEKAADRWAPPSEEPAIGVSCAACHAAHGAHEGALVRTVEVPSILGNTADSLPPATRVCLPCHTADAERGATQALLWLGRGGSAPGPAAHAAIEKGCLGCHAGEDATTTHGNNHSFSVDWSRCEPCHAGIDVRALTRSAKAELAQEIATVEKRWGVSVSGRHARVGESDRSTARGRALADLDIVLGDPSAAAHNAAYARALLR